MMAKWFLFHTRVGGLLVAALENWAGLALVDADWLGSQPSGMPVSQTEG
jgi:hypothetical protein